MTQEHHAAGGIVVHEGHDEFQVLLIKDGYGRWTWPKGHVEPGETSRQAALREIQEETGLQDLEILQKTGQQKYFYTLEGARIHKTVDIYLVRSASTEPLEVQTEEIRRAEWFTPGDALNIIEYKGSKGLLEKGIDHFREQNRTGGRDE